MLLTKGNQVIAFTTAFLFGIHPMHAESVAWVSERKDVLYGFFFLAGLISYTKYVDNGSRKQYFLTILYLIFSLLSKPAAVIFPITLFCIDLLRSREWRFKLITEKLPFFALALVMGIVTFLVQKEAGAVAVEYFGLGTRLLFGFYGVMMYIIKMILPFNLSPFYPFPNTTINLPAEYYLAPLFFLALAAVVYFSIKKNKVLAFGILFFLINLLLVLQVVSIGSAVMADRYTYIPYIGLFFIIGWMIDRYSKGNLSKANSIILPVSFILAFICFRQAATWTNGGTLWDHAIKTQPGSRVYHLRAMLFAKEKNYDPAIEYYNKAIELSPSDNEAYNGRGIMYMDLGKFDLAYQDYKRALSIKPDFFTAMDNLGAWFAIRGQYDSSLLYLNSALKVNPDYAPAIRNRGLTFMALRRYEEAIKDFEKFLFYEPRRAGIHNTIGVSYQNLQKYPESIAAFTKAIEFSPEAVFYLNRSYSYNSLKNTEMAKRDALIAKQGGAQIPVEYAKALGIQ